MLRFETDWQIMFEGMVESAVAWLGDEEEINVPGVVDFYTFLSGSILFLWTFYHKQ